MDINQQDYARQKIEYSQRKIDFHLKANRKNSKNMISFHRKRIKRLKDTYLTINVTTTNKLIEQQ